MEWMLSADCHVIEPPSTWDRTPKKYLDRAPRVRRVEGHSQLGTQAGEQVDWWFMGDEPLMPVFTPRPGLRHELGGARHVPMEGQLGSVLGTLGTDEYTGNDYVADLEVDRIKGAVLYPTTALFLYRIDEVPFVSALFGAYNDWLAEFCAARPKELKAAAAICMDDPKVAVDEMKRTREMGMVTALIPVAPPEGRTFGDPMWEPIWSAAEDLEMVISFHVATNRVKSQTLITPTMHNTFDNYPKTALSDMIFSGVFLRHPRLHVTIAEFELGWIPFFLDRMDYTYTQRRRREGWLDFPDGVLPSHFWHQNCSASFQEDPTVAAEHWQMIGVDTVMIGTDFPHVETTYPKSLEKSNEVLAALTSADREKVCFGNAERLLGMSL
jgi:predicted TIM-barrel fold metal-dependent hydrolase